MHKASSSKWICQMSNSIWNKISNLLKKGFDSEPVYVYL